MIKICEKHGDGVCVGCNRNPSTSSEEILCRFDAVKCLEILAKISHTSIADLQKQILTNQYILQKEEE